jgi:acetyl/propionyl-CoA carboxylase alpha subunit
MRESESLDSGATSKTIVALMPRKILQVLKKDGEVVGLETVMTVESMKMEIAMSMTQGGKFKAFVGKGDSVDEETLLCRVV